MHRLTFIRQRNILYMHHSYFPAPLQDADIPVFKYRRKTAFAAMFFNTRIKEHCSKGGLASVFENGYISILKGSWKIRVMHVKDIPLTYEGKAVHNVANCLPSVLAAYLFRDITIGDIR